MNPIAPDRPRDSGGSSLDLAGPALSETLDGGQCFRWNRGPDGAWRGISGGCSAEVRETPAGASARVIAGSASDLRWHLADDCDWRGLADALPWRTDAHLARCIAAFPGLRILRQPLGEALLCFLCSATKQIVQIKQMAELLASRFGRVLAPGPTASASTSADSRRALPTWEALASVPEVELRACKLGFRARHVHAIARHLAEQPDWLAETEALPYAEAKARLITLPGVGEKIADCVLLFGAARLAAFPVDVWILRALARRYRLEGWRPAQVIRFGQAHFGPLAGLAQQYLFAWERRHGHATAV